MTRAVVVGGGSIGVRHAGVLDDLGLEVVVVTSRDDLDVPVERSLAAAVAGADYVVVATETGRRAATIAELGAAGYHGPLLIEKPLAVDETALAGFARVGVGFNLRFHPVVRRLQELLAGTDVYTVEAYAGQHLSTWRPSRPVADQYSASRAEGGGVLRDLSHELDYLGLLFGACAGLFALGGRLGSVTVDSDDAWGIVARYERAPLLTLQLNYLDTTTRRRIVATTSTGTVEADLVAGTVGTGDALERLGADRDDTYRVMHEAMLSDAVGVASATDGATVDAVIAMAERSAATGTWVSA